MSAIGKPIRNVTGGATGILCGGMARQAGISGTCTAPIPISGISGMKGERFVAGQLWIERNRRREGPEITYTVLCGKSSRLFTDHKMILRHVKWPKGTPTGDSLREWLGSFEQKPKAPAPETAFVERIKAESWGPEAHDPEDPTANTKMVT